MLFPKVIQYHCDRSSKASQIAVAVQKHTMDAGDYALKGYVRECLFERKGALRELHNNLFTKDWKRSQVALDKLAEASEHPYLVLETSPSELFRKTLHVPNYEKVFDNLVRECVVRGISLLYPGNCRSQRARRILGEQLIRIALVHIQHSKEAKQ